MNRSLPPLGDDFSRLTFSNLAPPQHYVITPKKRKIAHHYVMGEAIGEDDPVPIAVETMFPQEESTRSSEEPLAEDWVINKISRVSNDSSIPLNERDSSSGGQSTMTTGTGNTDITTSSDEEEELVDDSADNEVEQSSTDEGTFDAAFDVGIRKGSAFETFDANNRLRNRGIEIFDPNDPPQRSIPSPDLRVNGAIALDHRVLSSSSKESSFSLFSGTTIAADNTTKEACALEDSVISEDDEQAEEKEVEPSKHRHAIFCILVLVLIVGATAFIFFGTGLANSLREKNSLRGTEDTDTSVTTSAGDESTDPTPTASSLFGILSPFSGDLLKDSNTPQYHAFQWMHNEDDVANDPDTHPARILQRYALLTTLYSLIRRNSFFRFYS